MSDTQRRHDYMQGQECTVCGSRMGSADGMKPCPGPPPWARERVASVIGFDPTTGETVDGPDEEPTLTETLHELARVTDNLGGITFDEVLQERHGPDTGSAVARKTDPETSHKAARRLKPGSLNSRIVTALQEHGPMTEKEISDLLKEERVNVSPRIRPLRRAGFVRSTGQTRINEGTESEAIVWEAGAEPEPIAERISMRSRLATAEWRVKHQEGIIEKLEAELLAAQRTGADAERVRADMQNIVDGLRSELRQSERARQRTDRLLRKNMTEANENGAESERE